jgi:glutamine synthetase
LEKVRDNQVKFLRFQFVDVFGVLKNIAVTSEDLDNFLAGRVAFENSVVDGVFDIREQDIILHPDLSTFMVFPWRPRDGAVARFLCNVVNFDGTPYPGCSRGVLKKVLEDASELGVEIWAGAKVEFYLFHTDNKGNPTTEAHDSGGYCDLTPLDMGENARRDMVLTMEEMGLDIGSSHHGVGPGQHGISLKPDKALAIADKLITLRFIVRTMAQRHGLHASFMPKPLNGRPGSGLHLHLFLRRREEVLFQENRQVSSQEIQSFMGGILEHARSNTALTNPVINSYKRLLDADMAMPVYIGWTEDRRDSILRLVGKKGEEVGIEVRNPDSTCNPFLAMAAIIKAGLNGIGAKTTPPPPLAEKVLMENESQLQGERAARLPGTLEEALRELKADQLIRATLGEHICGRFFRAKAKEWERFQKFVHPWELKEYLSTF